VSVFTCSGASGLAFEDKKGRNVFFDAVKDNMYHCVGFKNSR
jgi:hypothetical protein